MTVENCGEILPGEDWNFCDDDRSGEKLPPFPEDWDKKNEHFFGTFNKLENKIIA